MKLWLRILSLCKKRSWKKKWAAKHPIVENNNRKKNKERSKEIVKERSGIKKLENKDSKERRNKGTHFLFEHPNKIDTPLQDWSGMTVRRNK